jgi:hypothetical protein
MAATTPALLLGARSRQSILIAAGTGSRRARPAKGLLDAQLGMS